MNSLLTYVRVKLFVRFLLFATMTYFEHMYFLHLSFYIVNLIFF